MLALNGDGNKNDTEQRLQPKLQPAPRKNLKLTIVKTSKLLPFAGKKKCILLNEDHCLFMVIEMVVEIVGFEW